MELTDKVCLVTGGSGGIGSATALEFARRGANVAIGCREAGKEAALRLKSQVESPGRKSTVVPGDVAESEQALELVKGTVTNLRGLDVLVQFAGGPVPGDLTRVSPRA